MKVIGIYKITSPKGRIYIGQSVDIYYRFKKYRLLSGGLKKQTRLYNSLLKYGHEAHKFEILEICNQSDLNEKEALFIKMYDSFDTENGLNLTSGGDKTRASLETRNKISLANKNRSEQTREKIRLSKIGNKNMLGKRHTEKSKEMIRLKKTGVKLTKDHRDKIGKSHIGTKRSVDSRIKMSISMQRARILDTETGIIYIGYNSVMELIDMKRTTFMAQLTGQNKNKTKYILL